MSVIFRKRKDRVGSSFLKTKEVRYEYKKIISLFIAVSMLVSNIVITSVYADGTYGDKTLDDANKLFAVEYYRVGNKNETKLFEPADAEGAGWIVASGSYKYDAYLGILGNSEVIMSDGYEATDWTAVQFGVSVNCGGDFALYDADGKAIIGICSNQNRGGGFWVGHGDRSFGGVMADNYGVKRFANYLKTEITHTVTDNTCNFTITEGGDCVILIENCSGTVTDLANSVNRISYTGDYYTVKTYYEGELMSTEYYSGSRNGIGGIKTVGNQYM